MKRRIAYLITVFFLVLPTIIWAAQRTITTYTWDRDIGIITSGGSGPDINFTDDIEDFTKGSSTPNSVNINKENKIVNLGNSQQNSCGVLWYGGTHEAGSCVDGKCNFGIGLRAYFDFRFLTADSSEYSTTNGDGFTFAVMNANDNGNGLADRGGPPPGVTGTFQGELMCYAGSGTSGNGLREPKLAVEYDTYGNNGPMDANGCSSGRADQNNRLNHTSLMYWGDTKAGNCQGNSDARSTNVTCEQKTYDDNIHGQCASECKNPGPINSATGDGTGGYCQRTGGKVKVGPTTYNWMEDGRTHHARIEITRSSDRRYIVKAWVDCEQPCCSGSTCEPCREVEILNFQNILNKYNNPSFLPKINRQIQLNESSHNAFEKIIFGFTQATGTQTQNIEISNLKVYFPKATDCDYTLDPYTAVYDAAGDSGKTVSVDTTSGCNWTASSNASSWLKIKDGSNGVGDGTVTYDVDPTNSTSERTGTITIASTIAGTNSKLFVEVVQKGVCPFTVNPTSRTVSYSAGSGSISLNMTGNCSWSASRSATWLTITSGASGTGSGAINYSYTGNGGWLTSPRTANITVTSSGVSQSFSLCQQGSFFGFSYGCD